MIIHLPIEFYQLRYFKKLFSSLFLLLLHFLSLGQATIPANIETILKETSNRHEFVKIIAHCKNAHDPLVLKSAYFLIANMGIHYTDNYYWADKSGLRIAYNELSYSSFNEAVEALNQLKSKHPGLHPVAYRYRDLDSVKADFIIENIELAVLKYRENSYKVNESDFFEYLLPYRVSTEPMQDWRKVYATKCGNCFTGNHPATTIISELKQSINSEFKNMWGLEEKTEPLPRLGALQILLRGKGLCEDGADMATFIARAHGIPSAVDNVPFWATAIGNHFLNYLPLDEKHTHFDSVLDSLGREPSKVLRTTFSSQPDAIATWLDTALIPNNFLRLKNYKDVTDEYWKTETITCPVDARTKFKVAFAAVLNGGTWQPIWYGNISGNIATFKNMTKGVVYLPFFYEKGSLIPAGWPYALGYNNKAILKPDMQHLRTIVLNEEEKYLKYRPGKKYRLFIWNNEWVRIGEQVASPDCIALTFKNVPSNALLLLIPEYTRGKERPFMIAANGNRIWW